ncbi:MAG: hypothetical protein HY682_10195 [Chloroflexi bacterium]|nr:hypothetical protein [Chloroflexota bacterium]
MPIVDAHPHIYAADRKKYPTMKITSIETIRIQEFHHVLWVQVHTDAGYAGLGETWYLPRAVAAVIHDVYAPYLIGKNPMDRERLWDLMYGIAESFG